MKSRAGAFPRSVWYRHTIMSASPAQLVHHARYTPAIPHSFQAGPVMNGNRSSRQPPAAIMARPSDYAREGQQSLRDSEFLQGLRPEARGLAVLLIVLKRIR